MNRVILARAAVALIGCGLLTVHSAFGGEEQTETISSYTRFELFGGDPTYNGVYQISENGVAVGSVGISSPARWVNGNLDWFDDDVSGQATSVSDDGAWLGGSSSDGRVVFRKHEDDPLEELPLLEHGEGVDALGYVTGIRSDGMAVGLCSLSDGATSTQHAVRWTPEGQIERLLPNTALSSAAAINEAGAIIGTYQTTVNAPKHAFLIDDGLILDPTEGAEGTSEARALSPGGLIAGTLLRGDEMFWFLNRGGQLTLIPVIPNNGGPTGVNDSGLIVGHRSNLGPEAWLDGRFYSLNALNERSDPVTLTSALDVNNAGQIAANGYERIGFVSERYTANMLLPLDTGPDLQGTLVKFRRRSGGRLYSVQGTLLVKNAGSEPAAKSVAEVNLAANPSTDRLGLSDRRIRIPALAPGEEQRVRFNLVLRGPREARVVRIELDAANRVPEVNESNNLIEAPLMRTR